LFFRTISVFTTHISPVVFSSTPRRRIVARNKNIRRL
jgi:hypothetical protein